MTKREYRIAVVPGDGIGLEVMPEALKILDKLSETSGGQIGFSFETFPWGSHHFLKTGKVMDEGGLDELRAFDAILFGATGWPTVPDHISLYGFRLVVCKGFDLFASVRPVRLFSGITSPLRSGTPESIDWIMVRENSEGEYSGIGGRNLAARGEGRELAIESALFTTEGCERIIRYAFEIASYSPSSPCHQCDQEQCPAIWHDPVGRLFRASSGGVSECRRRPGSGRRVRRPDGVASGFVRCRRGVQSLWRHPVRSWWSDRRQSGHCRKREHRSLATLSEHVRAGARFSA